MELLEHPVESGWECGKAGRALLPTALTGGYGLYVGTNWANL